MFAFISEVQLALDSLDRLVETLEERGPLSASDAARALFATSSISDGLACSLLAEVTAGDSRIVCAGATVSLAGTQPDPLLEEAELVVFDLETTGLSASTRPHLRGRRGSRAGAGAGRVVPVARQPESCAAGPRRPPHRAARPGAARGASDLHRARPLPDVRGRFAPRGAQRALRPALSRTAALAHARSAPVRAAALHRRTRSPTARGARAPGQPRLARPLLRCSDDAVPPGPARRRGDGAGAGAPDRPRPGDRRAPPLRSPRACCSSQTTGLRQTLAGTRRAHAARRVLLSGPAGAGALRGPGARPAGAPSLLLPKRSPAPVRRSGPARPRATSSGACSVRSSRPRSKSCA